jgi:hypothetical protein
LQGGNHAVKDIAHARLLNAAVCSYVVLVNSFEPPNVIVSVRYDVYI